MAAVTERQIGELARRQHGVVSRGQLMDLGLRPGAILRRARSGALRRLHRGVYQVGPVLPPAGREMAAVLACGPATLVADWSAAALWRITSTGTDGAPTGTAAASTRTAAARVSTDIAPVHVLRIGRGGRSRPGISVRRVARLDDRDRTVLDGVPVTTPGRTLVDIAAAGASTGHLERAVARAERDVS